MQLAVSSFVFCDRQVRQMVQPGHKGGNVRIADHGGFTGPFGLWPGWCWLLF